MLFHALTVRVEDIDAEFARSTIEAFVADFYKCKECRDLFSKWTSRFVNS